MNQISHKQAIQWINRRLDGLLNEQQTFLLAKHLQSCGSCRRYAAEMELLPVHLQNEFRVRWDEKAHPSQKVLQGITAKARNIPTANRISSGIRWFAGAAALVLLGIVINFAISQLQNTSGLADRPIAGPEATTGLLAFASDQNGNFDIYTIRPDGSGLTNLTNNPANDDSPIWSPDGKRIVFESDRDRLDGNDAMDIYSMNADGSDVARLTDGEGDYKIDQRYTPWSPDGTKLLFSYRAEEASGLYVMDANGENKILLSRVSGFSPSWSPDGQRIAFLVMGPPAEYSHLYIMNVDGSNSIDLGQFLSENENIYAYDGYYYWSPDGQSISYSTIQYIDGGHGPWIFYEYNLLDNRLTERARSNEFLDWWRGTSFIAPAPIDRSSPMTWLRPDGSSTTLNPFESCGPINKPAYNWKFQRSSHGNLVIAAPCPEGGWQLSWANSDGTATKQLLDTPIIVDDFIFTGMAWSPDDKFVTFFGTDGLLYGMYILNVEAALRDPSTQPLKVGTRSNRFGDSSWQSVWNNEVVEEEPTSTDSPAATDLPILTPTDTLVATDTLAPTDSLTATAIPTLASTDPSVPTDLPAVTDIPTLASVDTPIASDAPTLVLTNTPIATDTPNSN